MGMHSHSNTTCVLPRNENREKLTLKIIFSQTSYQIFVTVSRNTACDPKRNC